MLARLDQEGEDLLNYTLLVTEERLGCRMYFADPNCAWKKWTNENSNGLPREFHPKGRDLSGF